MKKMITFPTSHNHGSKENVAPLETEGHRPGPHFPLNHDYGRKKRSRKEIYGKLHCHKPPNMKMSCLVPRRIRLNRNAQKVDV